ncbi:hypothetical protein Pla123a_46380 [Posidoniimonas polymericola]|uniref:PEP-CTERM protein-sorting domain-containing protein n=1 Tax=Posidoniimonas polymericola TaxID=2528002 RepID=A0A5C5XV48_9BACT|nr:hypothetical protein [Posidoniimonas polymericola]TWT66750.1 hypothetical protein Pla123a_46380 [Posidoniimonas polymericola]
MFWRQTKILLLMLLVGQAPAGAAPAQFWLSLDDHNATGPAVATGVGADGVALRVHVWARPQTAGSTQMENFSLNIVSSSTDFDIDADTVEVYNPVLASSRPRFEFVNDSAEGLIGVDSGLPLGFNRGIAGLQGFTFDSSAADGFGGVCDTKDAYCDDSSGVESWLVASFSLVPSASVGSAELYLQVGLNGMSHAGEFPGDMEVTFGVDSIGAAPPPYDPENDYHLIHGDDDPDAVVSFVKLGDYDADGDVDTDDYTVWESEYAGGNYAADGTFDRIVDAADYTVWRDNLPASPGPAAATTIPAPSGAGCLLGVGVAAATRRRRGSRPLASSATG